MSESPKPATDPAQGTPKADPQVQVDAGVQKFYGENGTGAPASAPAADPASSPAAPKAEDKPNDQAATPAKAEEKPVEKKEGDQGTPPPELKLTLPEGSKLVQADVEAIQSFAKTNGLNEQQAQALLKQESDRAATKEADTQRLQEHQLEAKKTEWLELAKSDPEVGGDNLGPSIELAKRAIEKFAPADLKELLERTGLGNHPGLLKTLSRVGKAISEPSYVKAGATPPKAKSAEDTFYPSTAQPTP